MSCCFSYLQPSPKSSKRGSDDGDDDEDDGDEDDTLSISPTEVDPERLKAFNVCILPLSNICLCFSRLYFTQIEKQETKTSDVG